MDPDRPLAALQLVVEPRMVWEEEHRMIPLGVQHLVPGRREGIVAPPGCG